MAPVPNQPKTPLRAFRIPDEEYLPAQRRAAREGETMTDVVRRAVREYGADEPDEGED